MKTGHFAIFWYIIIFVFTILISGCAPEEELIYTGTVEKIVFGVEMSLLPSLVWVAENQGYFSEQGLDVEIKEFDSGKNAFKTMLEQGNLDMVTVAQTPVMFNSFNRNDYRIIAGMVSSYKDVNILARKDKGISKPEDLKGKKIGATAGSTGHYFLGLFLTHNGLILSDIEISDFKATELAQALIDGKVDAISSWEPNIYNARKQLGENAIILPNKDIFREDFYFVPNKAFLDKNPQAIERFLKAIEKAEEFIKNYNEKAINITAERLKINQEFVASVWGDFDFNLLLDQSVLSVLENEARWAISNNLTNATEIPNYLNYIYTDALKKVKPEAVAIFGD